MDKFIIILLLISIVAALFFHSKKDFKKAAVIFLAGSLLFGIFGGEIYGFLPAAFSVIYAARVWKAVKTTKLFSIQLAGGTFSFIMDDYPHQEFSDFAQQASLLKARGVVNIRSISFHGKEGPNTTSVRQSYAPASHYQVSAGEERKPGHGILIAVIILIIVIIGAFAINALNHAANTCKVRDCEDSVYMDGYCRYHYNTHKIDDTAKDVYDGLFGK
ncbi:MAG: hypothetical protein HDT15_01960 [Oscillibacter sp.]|nr:hypothetical protein [Oscillibacter sp.]